MILSLKKKKKDCQRSSLRTVFVSFFSLTSSTLDVNEFSICTSTNTVSVLLRTLLDFEEFGERFIVLRYFAVNVVKWYHHR